MYRLAGVPKVPRRTLSSTIDIVNRRIKLFPLMTMILYMLLATPLISARAQIGSGTEINSTPQRLSIEMPAAAPADRSAPAVVLEVPQDTVTIGLNFQGSELFVDSFSIPPDSMGAVGLEHIVQMINGRFNIYSKSTGAMVFTRSLDSFWSDIVGLTIPDGEHTFDPRIVFDPATGRWFATSIDGTEPNNIYLARSDTGNPTGTWLGVRFTADTVGVAEFHDYDTLAVDADGLYICTNDFGTIFGDESCYSIPKADLLQATPSIANMTRFEATPSGLPTVDGSMQPALDFGPSDGRAALLGVSGGRLVRGNIFGAGGAGAYLGTITGILGAPGHSTAPPARQPHPSEQTIENVSPRIVASVFEQGDSLWAVHAVLGSYDNSAIRWYEIDEVTNNLLQTGLIENLDEDFHEPSIAVNDFGQVVIGYTCSGPNLAPSACVSVGETIDGVTTFEIPFVVQEGAGHYWRDFRDPPSTERNRWGDYSATVLDPVDPCTFWTFQEFVAVSAVGDVGPSPLPEGGRWGIQITELTFKNCGVTQGINFDNFVIQSYAGGQDQNSIVDIEDNGTTLHITGNGWKKIGFPHFLTPNTVIEFDFKSSVQGEIHGIGFDDDDVINNPFRTFKLYGTQIWGIPDFADYQNAAPNWQHYRIPVGQFYTGTMLYITFTNDQDDTLQGAESFFSNLRVFEDSVELDFNEFLIQSYGGAQDQALLVEIEDNGATLHMTGNGWKKIYFPYTLTPNSVIEFDFKSNVAGEIHGIGFDEDDSINNPIRMFQLYGTQAWGIPDFNDYQYAAPAWQHYRIPVGRFYTGKMLYLTFSNDQDVAPHDAESFFSQIRVFEDAAELDFEDFTLQSYGGDQDQNPSVSIEDNGYTLHITGNGWKKIDFPYFLTPNTVIEFDFKSSVPGEIHGIGFDNDDRINNPIRTFQLYGSQSWGISDFNDYQNAAPAWKHYRIPVGQFYTGAALYLTFTNDDDGAPQDGESFFANVRVFED